MSIGPIFGNSAFVNQPLENASRGWDRVSWGAAKERVENIYPQAQPGRFGSLKIYGADVAENYDIVFAFDQDERLKSVELAFHGVPSDESFMELKRWLTDQFGPSTVSGAWEYSWRRGQTEIILKRGHNLTITYRKAASQPA